jgi:hypothetical protein
MSFILRERIAFRSLSLFDLPVAHTQFIHFKYPYAFSAFIPLEGLPIHLIISLFIPPPPPLASREYL